MTLPPDDHGPGSAIAFTALPGWAGADHGGAWQALRASAWAHVSGQDALRLACPAPPAVSELCTRVAAMPERLDPAAARHAFETLFEPRRLAPEGFLTGYYEPFVDASLEPASGFTAPIIGRPAFLNGLPPEQIPDRAALEAFALTPAAQPVAWLADWVELFLIHVQGSARLRLPDGRLRRLVETGRMAPDAMSLDALKTWLRAAGQEPGQAGRALTQENRSYIFFRLEDEEAPAAGPIGGQGLPLTPGISIAVDRSLWCYGLPFFIEAATALPGFSADPFSGLFVAQDTGSAILGPARADLFLGSRDEAGAAARRIRHAAQFTVLWPRQP